MADGSAESFAPGSQYNLITDYPEIISPSDQLMVILHALGGRDVPDAILRSLGSSQRRWNTDGEIESLTPEEFGLHPDLILTLSTEQTYSDASFSPYVTRHTLHSGIDAWSIHPDVTALLNEVLQPRIWEEMGITAVKLLSFACPPCYEGNVTWYVPQAQGGRLCTANHAD